MLTQNHGEPCEGLPSFPDGIEPGGVAALIESLRDERWALRAIVQDAVAAAVYQRSDTAMTTATLLWGKGAEADRWRMLAVAVSKAALGVAGSEREAGELWGLERDRTRELLAEHRRRMTHFQGWHEYRADAEAVAAAVMAATYELTD